MILYTLVIFALSGETLYVEPRTLYFEECRMQRELELTRYQLYHNQKVHVVCTPTNGAHE